MREISEGISKIIKKYREQKANLEFGSYWLNSAAIGIGRWFDETIENWRDNKNILNLVEEIAFKL